MAPLCCPDSDGMVFLGLWSWLGTSFKVCTVVHSGPCALHRKSALSRNLLAINITCFIPSSHGPLSTPPQRLAFILVSVKDSQVGNSAWEEAWLWPLHGVAACTHTEILRLTHDSTRIIFTLPGVALCHTLPFVRRSPNGGHLGVHDIDCLRKSLVYTSCH